MSNCFRFHGCLDETDKPRNKRKLEVQQKLDVPCAGRRVLTNSGSSVVAAAATTAAAAFAATLAAAEAPACSLCPLNLLRPPTRRPLVSYSGSIKTGWRRKLTAKEQSSSGGTPRKPLGDPAIMLSPPRCLCSRGDPRRLLNIIYCMFRRQS